MSITINSPTDVQMVDTIVKSCICVRADVGHAMQIAKLAAKLPQSFRTTCGYGRFTTQSVVPTTVRPLLEQAYERALAVLAFNARMAERRKEGRS